MAEGRLKLVVLGGYLGSGKTSWLRHHLLEAAAPVHVLVNEAAETPVDHGLLGGASGLSVLSGGCACCTGREALVTRLRALCDGWSRKGADRPARIILETSGLADPAAIVGAIRGDPVLQHHLLLEEIIVLVDALHASAQLRKEPLGRAQVQVADRLIITKAAQSDRAALAQLLSDLTTLNPGAGVTAAELGVPQPLPDLPAHAVQPLPPLMQTDGSEPVRAMRLDVGGVDWATFSLWLSALLHARGDDLVRIKGVLRTPAGRLLLQTVQRQVQAPEVLPDLPGPEDDQLVILGRGCSASQLRRSLQAFSG